MKFGNGYIGYDTGLQGKTTQLTLEQHRFEHVPDHFYVDFVFFFNSKFRSTPGSKVWLTGFFNRKYCTAI